MQPLPSGATALTLTPLELLDRLAAPIPPPRRHRHHYCGAFAPHAGLRARVTACAAKPATEIAPPGPDPSVPAPTRPRARDPPELEPAGSFAFDQSLPWDPTTPTPDPGFSFAQVAP